MNNKNQTLRKYLELQYNAIQKCCGSLKEAIKQKTCLNNCEEEFKAKYYLSQHISELKPFNLTAQLIDYEQLKKTTVKTTTTRIKTSSLPNSISFLFILLASMLVFVIIIKFVDKVDKTTTTETRMDNCLSDISSSTPVDDTFSLAPPSSSIISARPPTVDLVSTSASYHHTGTKNLVRNRFFSI
ncbi:unnamed protein product [Didymodactylos carnosus]|uniref:Uncharacterized protein n=2 Tax=Didymodactylos carnosus TaxID=1234261 RepID=A0A815W9T5_9BILA|nr:unnamed protein product [Didymodactylos carnosus]CAF4405779.1 unnamed protein product [Didymodactylos carnosus]